MSGLHRLAAALTIVIAGSAQAGEEVAATPYRPTVANPAELPAPGWLEVEAGWLRNAGDGPTRNALPYTAKLAFNEDWGVLLGGELWAREREDGETIRGRGDASLVLKHRIAVDERRAFGIEAGVNLPTAEDGLGSDKPDWTLTGIYSVDFAEDWRLDVNAGATRVGAPEDGEGRVAGSWAASVSHGMDAWTLAGELSGSHRRGVSDTVQALAAVGYAVTPGVVLDAGISVGREGSAAQHALFFGVTWLAGRLF